jgi:hypothetical protein
VPYHRKLKRLIPWGLIGYALLGVASIPTPRHEIFPFFCWFLFPITPNVEPRYGLVVRQNGAHDVEPVRYEQAVGTVAQPHSMDAHVAIQALGRAVRLGDAGATVRLRRTLEGNFLSAPCRYDLVFTQIDAYAVWNGAPPPTQTLLRAFVCNQAESGEPF